MSLFNEKFQPGQLDAPGFRDFVLHSFRAYAVDMSQPMMWTKVARIGDGAGVSRSRLARELAKPLGELGAVLTPKLLNKMVAMFLIHGPELADDLKHVNRNEVVDA